MIKRYFVRLQFYQRNTWPFVYLVLELSKELTNKSGVRSAPPDSYLERFGYSACTSAGISGCSAGLAELSPSIIL
jgi:hypothetical protein